MTKKPCVHEYLANSYTGKVLICRDCGVVYLHLQNMSLRFDVEQFADLAAMMTTASKRLNHEPEETPQKRPILRLIH